MTGLYVRVTDYTEVADLLSQAMEALDEITTAYVTPCPNPAARLNAAMDKGAKVLIRAVAYKMLALAKGD